MLSGSSGQGGMPHGLDPRGSAGLPLAPAAFVSGAAGPTLSTANVLTMPPPASCSTQLGSAMKRSDPTSHSVQLLKCQVSVSPARCMLMRSGRPEARSSSNRAWACPRGGRGVGRCWKAPILPPSPSHPAHVRALDQPRQVGHGRSAREAPVLGVRISFQLSEVRNERGERVVCDLRPSGRDSGKKGGLSGVGEALGGGRGAKGRGGEREGEEERLRKASSLSMHY